MLSRAIRSARHLFKQSFATSVDFHQICRFEGDLAELHQSVRKFADEKVKPLA
jgi:hypothetical protein